MIWKQNLESGGFETNLVKTKVLVNRKLTHTSALAKELSRHYCQENRVAKYAEK